MVDLTDCDREPIHILGKIQPHGVLFVLSEPALTIAQVSENVGNHLPLGVEDVLVNHSQGH
jgi:light-regulated signal transduction histidine kinase (bacteriophytochrome)